jgi:hypothetical protein
MEHEECSAERAAEWARSPCKKGVPKRDDCIEKCLLGPPKPISPEGQESVAMMGRRCQRSCDKVYLPGCEKFEAFFRRY